MDNLRKSIRLIFTDYCPDLVLEINNNISIKEKDINNYITEQNFLEIGFRSFSNYSLDEIQNVYLKLYNDWFNDIHLGKEKNYFHVLNHFTSKVLVEEDLEPFVVYEHLLKWRDLSYYVGEDLLSTSYFAYLDTRSKRNRDFFGWRPTAFSNNRRLRQLLSKGIAENHFHLKGSGPVFDLSWINLMNHPTRFEEKFKKLNNEISLLTKVSNTAISSKKELKVLVYKAAYIRYFLSKVLRVNEEIKQDVDLSQESNQINSFELILEINKIAQNIEVLRFDIGHRFLHKGNLEVICKFQ